MAKIAFDIALLPPDNIMGICVELSQKFKNDSGRPTLNKTDNFPHVSFFFGMVEENELDTLIKKIDELLKDIKPFETGLQKLVSITRPVGYTGHFFGMEYEEAYKQIHEMMVNNLQIYYPHESTSDMFFTKENETIDDKTYVWFDNYITGSSKEKYWPHITLKACSNPIYTDLPQKFTADRIAICHLGDHCTCRKILWETKLK